MAFYQYPMHLLYALYNCNCNSSLPFYQHHQHPLNLTVLQVLDYLITIHLHLPLHWNSPFAIPPLSDMRTRKCYFLPFVCRLCICTQINSSLFLPTDSSTTKWQFCHLQKEFAIKIKCFNQIQILHLTTFIACIQITVLAIVIKFSVHRFNSYSIPLKLRSKVNEFQRVHRYD